MVTFDILYLVASVLFILGLKMLTKVGTARHGNWVSSTAMFLAVLTTLLATKSLDWRWIIAGIALGSIIGAIMSIKVKMTSMPEMVAVFNGFGGGASTLVAISQLMAMGFVLNRFDNTISLFLSILIGTVTFTGSMIAFAKLKGLISGQPIIFAGNHLVNLILGLAVIGLTTYILVTVADGDAGKADMVAIACWVVTGASFLLGILLVIPIGGADMPVVISLLNSYSGLAAASAGFVLNEKVLMISGALVGASGLILTQIMCKAMNRSLANVLFGGFGQADTSGGSKAAAGYDNVKSCGAEEAAMLFDSARDVIIVPGYGLAVAQAQHVTKELADLLTARGATVRYAIHPVAGRMPGHMNVLLAESNVPHEQLKDLDEINDDFKNADIALVLGANDVVNPAATKDKDSPIWGMPVLKVWEAKTCFVIKRSLSAGFAAIPNDLFNYNNNLMIYGDAKKVLTDLVHELKQL